MKSVVDFFGHGHAHGHGHVGFCHYLFSLMSFIFCLSNLYSEDAKLSQYIKYSPTEANRVGYITITDRNSAISDATWLYVKQALEYYKKSKPIFIILELNTPGGEVFAAENISDALKDIDTQYDIPVVAFINNWAMSAGAMLAYSCRFITVVKDASMGAAEPILASQTGETKEASEKVNSALRTDFANRANFFGRNPYIAEAMVDKDTILVMRQGKIIKLDNESQIEKTDILISPKGKLLTLGAEDLLKYGVADLLLLPKKLSPITPEEKEAGKWPAGKTLLFQEPFFSKIPNATIDFYEMDWKTKFFVLLASPIVSSILMLGLMLGFYMEISSPGFGLPATIAIICLFLIVLSYMSLNIASWLEVILLFSGIAILLIDFFVLPTFGLLGVFGLVLTFVGLFGILLPGLSSLSFDFDTKTLNAAGEAVIERLSWLFAALFLGLGLMILMGRYVTPKFAAWSRLVLQGGEQEGYIAGDDPKKLPPPGTKGVVFATLRPAGKIKIGDEIYEALTSGGFIEKGTPIVVQKLDGSVIIVNREST